MFCEQTGAAGEYRLNEGLGKYRARVRKIQDLRIKI